MPFFSALAAACLADLDAGLGLPSVVGPRAALVAGSGHGLRDQHRRQPVGP